MLYRTLGNSDIKVSVIGLGTMTWGKQNDEKDAWEQMDVALDRGVNFFDTAEIYPVPPEEATSGDTERFIGTWLKNRGQRDKVVLAGKVCGRSSGLKWIRGGPRLEPSQIEAALNASLKRLGTDYIDLYQLHWPERQTNFFGALGYTHVEEDEPVAIEEQLHALDRLVKSGKVRHVGLSNETPWGVCAFLDHAKERSLPRVRSIQNPYSLLNRIFEIGLAEVAIRENCGLLAYSPLGFGVLSGKYLGNKKPKGARLTVFADQFPRYLQPIAQKATEKYVTLARENGLSPAQMALAFVNSRRFVTSNIIGATNIAQLTENIDSIDCRLSDALCAEIDKIHKEIPNPAP